MIVFFLDLVQLYEWSASAAPTPLPRRAEAVSIDGTNYRVDVVVHCFDTVKYQHEVHIHLQKEPKP